MDYTGIRLSGLTNINLLIQGATPTDPFILKGVDGLGAPPIDQSISNTLHQKAIHQNTRPQNKQIIVRVGINPDYSTGQTVSELITMLYGLLTGSTRNAPVGVKLLDGTDVICGIDGYVSKMDEARFTKDPAVDITIDCLSPYLSAAEGVFLTGLDTAEPVIPNLGSAPSGFYMVLTFTAFLTDGWTITRVGMGDSEKMEFDFTFHENDILMFDTRFGSRKATVTRGGTVINLLADLTSDSEWFQLYGGDNIFSTSSQGFEWNDVYYLPEYWG